MEPNGVQGVTPSEQTQIRFAEIASKERVDLAEIDRKRQAELADIERRKHIELENVSVKGKNFRRVVYALFGLIFTLMMVWGYLAGRTPAWQTIVMTLIAPTGLLAVLVKFWIRIWRKNRARIRDLEKVIAPDRTTSAEEGNTYSADEALKNIEAGAIPVPSIQPPTFPEINTKTSVNPQLQKKRGK